MVEGQLKLTVQYYIVLSWLTNNLYNGDEIYLESLLIIMTSYCNKLTKNVLTRGPGAVDRSNASSPIIGGLAETKASSCENVLGFDNKSRV